MGKTGYVALYGEFLNALDLNAAVREFGWSTRRVTGSALKSLTRLVAVLIHPKSLGMPWPKALKLIHYDLYTSGAFYTLLLPADPRELRFMLSELGAPMAAVPNKKQAQVRPRLLAQVAGAA
jgi:hypothetical protein